MLSIRMRASLGRGAAEAHISGAEGIYEERELPRIAEKYLQRAMGHPRGEPDRIVLTVERIRDKPRFITALPVATLRCGSPEEAEGHIRAILLKLGISGRAAGNALRVVRAGTAMRGACLMDAVTGRRMEPDRQRGVRASKIGVSREAGRALSARLSGRKICTDTVREAVLLASKVAFWKPVVAELCVSDDPDYTTGYIASRRFGYIRIPRIKEKGSHSGGRVFFLAPGADIKKTVAYL
nr:6-carboxyhexanoate--CoA ligase [Nitrospiraceae bacterium]